jgi:hypothetical protein
MTQLMNTMETVQSRGEQIFGRLESIVNQSFQNQLIAARNSQKRQIEAIEQKVEQGVLTEKQGQKRIEQVRSQSQEEIAKIKREQAQAEKRWAIANAIMNTAVAATKALQAGPVAGPILAGTISALGAAQVAAIESQPIPKFAEGGVVTGPTIGMVGEEGPEAIVPLDKTGAAGVTNIQVNGVTDPERAARIVIQKLNRAQRPF